MQIVCIAWNVKSCFLLHEISSYFLGNKKKIKEFVFCWISPVSGKPEVADSIRMHQVLWPWARHFITNLVLVSTQEDSIYNVREDTLQISFWRRFPADATFKYNVNYGLGSAYRILQTQKQNTLHENESTEDCYVSQ